MIEELRELADQALEHKRMVRFHRRRLNATYKELRRKCAHYGIALEELTNGRAPAGPGDRDGSPNNSH